MIKSPTRVTFITSGQPSANPRLVKEAVALSESGYKVTVIYVPITPWADSFDVALFQKYAAIKFVRAGYHSKNKKTGYRWARARRKMLFEIYRRFGDVFGAADYSTILFGQELLREAKRHPADIYIAHNLGALPVAVKVAKKYKAKVGFDAEDFHRGEFSEGSKEQHLTMLLEQKYFQALDYLTAASPLIAETYKNIFPALYPITINNVFTLRKSSSITASFDTKENLKLFWFSQVIGKQRGIEHIINAMGLLKQYSISLTLLGNITEEMRLHILACACEAGVQENLINFLAPVLEEQIVDIASIHDVGFSSEVSHCLNREYCLTNKIFTYLIAGNALILSDTQAQRQFLEENNGVGSLYKNGDPQSLGEVLKRYLHNPELLIMHKQNARKLAETKYNWEIESKKFLDVVRLTLQD